MSESDTEKLVLLRINHAWDIMSPLTDRQTESQIESREEIKGRKGN